MMLRRAAPEDADRLAAVHVTAWRETYAGLMPEALLAAQSVAARAAMWAEILGNPAAGTSAWLVEDGATLAGFGACGHQRDAGLRAAGFEAEIGALYLLRACQGQGLGRALMRAMAAQMQARGHTAIALWVLRENTAAHAFYRHLGGEVVAEKQDRRGTVALTELAYGWRDLSPLLDAAP